MVGIRIKIVIVLDPDLGISFVIDLRVLRVFNI